MPVHDNRGDTPCEAIDFDYSTSEAEAAFRALAPLIDDLRKDLADPSDRRLMLYERTLGLAVIPVLLRRAAIVVSRALARRRDAE